MNEDYLSKINAKIKEMDEEIVKLQKQAKEKGAKAQDELNKNLEKYKETHKELQKKLDTLAKSGKEAAKDVSAGVDRAMEEMKKAFQQARSRFQ